MPRAPRFVLPDPIGQDFGHYSSDHLSSTMPSPMRTFENLHEYGPEHIDTMLVESDGRGYYTVSITPSYGGTRTVLRVTGSQLIDLFRPSSQQARFMENNPSIAWPCTFNPGNHRWELVVPEHVAGERSTAATPDPAEPDLTSYAYTPLLDPTFQALPEVVRNHITDIQTKLRSARIALRTKDRHVRELKLKIEADRLDITRANRAKNNAIRKQGEAEQAKARAETAQAHAESILADLDRLRRTAVVWRDGTNGTTAKLNAFTDFCDALDSLPVPQD